MYCQECLEREVCAEVCPALEAHLRKLEVYERETIFSPGVLELLANRVLFTWPDLFPDQTYLWDRLTAGLQVLPPELLHTFVLRHYEGLSVAELSRRQNLHRTTVRRRLRLGMGLITAEMRKDGPVADPAIDSPEPAC
jgi:DNA-directed RNA polymerase specialized sigma24 family protein